MERHMVIFSHKVTNYYKFNKWNAFQVHLRDMRSYSDRAYFHRVGKEPLLYRTLGQQLQRAALEYGKRPALISCHEGKRYTFEELKHEAENIAVKLNEFDMQRGDHVGIWATNNVQWYISYLAAVLAGYPVVCINSALQQHEIKYTLKKAKVKTLITMAECGRNNFYGILKNIFPADKVSSLAPIEEPEFPALRRIIMQSDKPLKEFISWSELQRNPANSKAISYLNQQVDHLPPESPCHILFTSGTTGQPKMTVLSHFSCVNQGQQFGRFLKLNRGHKYICLTVPLFHAFGLSVIMCALSHGSTIVLPSPTFNGTSALESMVKERCNIMVGTPTMYVDMLEKQRKLKIPVHTLELGLVGGASCSPEIYSQTKSVFSLRELLIAYGMSESTSATFTQEGTENVSEAVNTVGRLYDHGEAKIIDDQGEIVCFGEPGELCVRGFFVMTEYLDDEDKTREVLDKHGWLRTGDKFILESNGVGRIVGRKKDTIIRGGENIFPKEIEDYLDTHEDVIEAQVIGVPDHRMGEEICAYLRLRPDVKELTTEDIKRFCKDHIAHFKVPNYVRFIDEFPKTTSGKIQKFKLVELFESELKIL